MSERILAGAILLFALYYGFEAYRLEVAFAYDPLGPKAFPLLLAIVLAIFAAIVLYSPEKQPVSWPKNRTLLKIILAIATISGYSVTLFWLGFILATAICVSLLALLFDANWQQSLWAGISSGLVFYALFGWLLQIPLPAPSW